MAAGDAYVAGARYSSSGAAYTTADATTVQGGFLSTSGMALLGFAAQVNPYGTLKVSGEPSSIFVDAFDGSVVDTTARWTLSGTVPTQTGGNFTLNGGTTANATSVAISQPTFAPPGLGFRITAAAITLAAAAVPNQNTHYFYGVGQVTAYAIGTPLTDGFGFEVDITGALCAVAWVAGVRYVINSTNPALITAAGSLPTGGVAAAFSAMSWPTAGPHIYAVIDRGDTAFFYIDSTDVPIGYCRNIQPQAQTLPVRIAKINAAAAVVASSFTCSGVVMGDSTSQNQTMSDPIYPWRRQIIGVDGSSSSAIGGQTTVAVAAAGSANVKATPGRLCRLVVTVAGTASLTLYDNAAGGSTGTIIGITPAVTSVGQVLDFNIPAAVGISAVGGAGSPGVTIGYN